MAVSLYKAVAILCRPWFFMTNSCRESAKAHVALFTIVIGAFSYQDLVREIKFFVHYEKQKAAQLVHSSPEQNFLISLIF